MWVFFAILKRISPQFEFKSLLHMHNSNVLHSDLKVRESFIIQGLLLFGDFEILKTCVTNLNSKA